MIQLESQSKGDICDFDLIQEADLPWLDRQTELGQQMHKARIECYMDDDVMTDDELLQNAQDMLHQSLLSAISEIRRD